MPSAASFVIDSTRWSSVVRCTRDGCSWRACTVDKAAAYLLLEAHIRHGHGDAVGAGRVHFSYRRASEL